MKSFFLTYQSQSDYGIIQQSITNHFRIKELAAWTIKKNRNALNSIAPSGTSPTICEAVLMARISSSTFSESCSIATYQKTLPRILTKASTKPVTLDSIMPGSPTAKQNRLAKILYKPKVSLSCRANFSRMSALAQNKTKI